MLFLGGPRARLQGVVQALQPRQRGRVARVEGDQRGGFEQVLQPCIGQGGAVAGLHHNRGRLRVGKAHRSQALGGPARGVVIQRPQRGVQAAGYRIGTGQGGGGREHPQQQHHNRVDGMTPCLPIVFHRPSLDRAETGASSMPDLTRECRDPALVINTTNERATPHARRGGAALDRRRIHLVHVDAVFFDRHLQLAARDAAVIGQRLQRGQDDEVAVHFEERTQ
ncbi:hypothetical protein D3C86_418060 [compost metagenome]